MDRDNEPFSAAPAVARNVAVDAYRGFVMLLMMAEVLRLARVARAFPDSRFWAILAFNQTHVPWAGCSLHDLIQPSFSFLVGVALPYSLARRLSTGASVRRLFGHVLWRSLLLVALGIFLRSMNRTQTYFTFEDTLTQIGLGYPCLFLLGMRSARVQWSALAVLLLGYWAAWALYAVRGRRDSRGVLAPAVLDVPAESLLADLTPRGAPGDPLVQSTMNSFAPTAVDDRCGSASSAT